MLQDHLEFSLPEPWNQTPLRGALVPLFGEACFKTKIWVAGMLMAVPGLFYVSTSILKEAVCPFAL